MPYEIPLLFTAGNWLMSTACCLSCFHIPNWAEMTCVCACPCLAALDDESAWEKRTARSRRCVKSFTVDPSPRPHPSYHPAQHLVESGDGQKCYVDFLALSVEPEEDEDEGMHDSEVL